MKGVIVKDVNSSFFKWHWTETSMASRFCLLEDRQNYPTLKRSCHVNQKQIFLSFLAIYLSLFLNIKYLPLSWLNYINSKVLTKRGNTKTTCQFQLFVQSLNMVKLYKKVQGHLFWWKSDFNVFLMGKYLVFTCLDIMWYKVRNLRKGNKCKLFIWSLDSIIKRDVVQKQNWHVMEF